MQFVQKLSNLINVERPRVIEELQLARSQGDLSENADYDAARDKQAQVEHRISEIENILSNCEVVDEKPLDSKVVSLGTKVTFKDLSDNTEHTVEIVGSVEADPLNECPIGLAMIGKHVGERTVVETSEPYEVEILNIALDD